MCSQGTDDPKNTIYTESFNVPFIIRYPQKIKPHVDSTLLSTVDIMPTLLSMAGLSKQIPASAEGRDLSPVLLDNGLECDTPDCALYIRNVNGPKDEEGMVRGFFPAARGIKTHRYTFEIAIKKDYSLKSVMIFDDMKDPYQMINIDYTSEPELFRSLLGLLEDKLKESDDIWYREGILNKLNL